MKCINQGKEHMTCVMTDNPNPDFYISLECVECVQQGQQVKSGLPVEKIEHPIKS